MKITVGITTFKYRFDKYFIHLLDKIKKISPDIEVIVAVNGEHNEMFDQTYRKKMLRFLSGYDNVYPIMFTEFRSLCKLWNNILINATNDHVLICNDDIMIDDPLFFSNLEQLIANNNGESFKLNGSWSHVLLNKHEIFELGGFPEVLLGIGEEDGYMEWKFGVVYNRVFKSEGIHGLLNYVDMSHTPTNTTAHASGKYSLFNQNVFYTELFEIDNERGIQAGICPAKLILGNIEHINYCPAEKFYLERKNEL